MSESWPLHPTPKKTEFLSQWIRRVAKCYGTTYPVFCRKVLHLDRDEIENLDKEPSAATLEILSKGTRQPIERLRKMVIPEEWLHMEEDIDKAIAEDPDFIEKWRRKRETGLNGEGMPWIDQVSLIHPRARSSECP